MCKAQNKILGKFRASQAASSHDMTMQNLGAKISAKFEQLKMSFESLSERLAALQESNRQARELIERLATIKFEPGSIALDSDDDNVLLELSAEIAQVLKEQDEDFERLQEDVLSIPTGGPNSELGRQRKVLDEAVEKNIKEVES